MIRIPEAQTPEARRVYLFLFILVMASAIAFQGWRTLLNNFVVEVGGMGGAQVGFIQSVREVPGFLALMVIYILLIIREQRLAALSVIVLGIGVASAGYLPSFWGVVLTTVAMSFGFHYFETLNMSLTLQHFDIREAPVVSGRLKAVASAGNLLVGGLIFVMAMSFEYATMFLVVGGIAVAAGIVCLGFKPFRGRTEQNRGMVFRKRYWLFYGLTFMGGARRQIFVAFAVFLLVEKFGYSVQAVTALFIANNIINYYFSPLIGKAINRFGERAVLSLEYGSLLLIFAGYALTDNAYVAGGLYILDHIFFNFAIAIRTFFQKIADPKDIAPSMAVGFTINHIAAVAIPVLGGLAWSSGYRWVFFGGMLLSGVSLVLTQFIGGQLRKNGFAGERRADESAGQRPAPGLKGPDRH